MARRVRATLVRHLRTFTASERGTRPDYPYATGSVDLDLYRTRCGEVEGLSSEVDCRQPVVAWVSEEMALALGMRRRKTVAR